MNKLYEALEICLNEIEQGADVDTVLFRYPELADELRPILEASVKAKEMSVPAPSQEVLRKNRAKLLQHASAMREAKNAPASRRIWSVPLRRALVSLMVVVMLFVSSTGLVRAASTTLPGDNLYPVKRTWEGMLVFFTFDVNAREMLELEHENERLEELHELFAEGRSANVEFAGYVTRQSPTEWRVAGITVFISPETRLDQLVEVGSAVRVKGNVQSSTSIIAERIELLAPGSIVPEVEDNDDGLEIEEEKPEELDDESDDDSGTGSRPEATVVAVVKTPMPIVEREDESLEGAVASIENNFIVVKGILMDIRSAEVKGTPSVGAIAKVEGYYDTSGVFIVTRIEFKDAGSTGGSGDDNDSNDNSNDDNGNDDNSNDDNSNDDNNNEDDDNGDNSGSGSGDDD